MKTEHLFHLRFVFCEMRACVCACIGDSNVISSFNGYGYQKEVEKSMPFGINSLTYLNHTIRIAVEILNKSNKKKIYALYYHQ